MEKKAVITSVLIACLLMTLHFNGLGLANTDDAVITDKGETVNLDMKPALLQLGFTQDNYSLAPQRLVDALYRIPTNVTKNLDGSFNATIHLNQTQINSLRSDSSLWLNYDAFYKSIQPIDNGSNVKTARSSSIPIVSNNTAFGRIRNCTTVDSAPKCSGSLTDIGSSGRSACLIVAIWDYEYAEDLYDNAYNIVIGNATGYDEVVSLTNSDATRYNIMSTMFTLCDEYSDVDVYLIGHGTHTILGAYYFDSYDADNGRFWNGIYSQDFMPYYYGPSLSSLRTGVGAFCYGWHLNEGWLYSRPSTHDRVFIGPEGDSNQGPWNNPGVIDAFLKIFTYDWCQQNYDSWEAYSAAYTAAEPYAEEYGVDNLLYSDSGSSGVYYDFYVVDAYDAGRLIGNGFGEWETGLEKQVHDEQYAHVYGGNYGDAGYINAMMNAVSSGEIVVYGYSASGYYNSDLYCWVSNDGLTWDPAPNNPVSVNDWDGLHYINFGEAPYPFTYIALVGYDDNGYSVSVCMDAVHVVQ
jgi:hypothetical protein